MSRKEVEMKWMFRAFIAAVIVVGGFSEAADAKLSVGETASKVSLRQEQDFNDGWEFRKEPATNWCSVTLPHDWAIESEFDTNGEPGAGRLPYAGTGWYRKRFTLDANAVGKSVFLDVGGAMTESDVYLNGVLVGSRKYGFSSYRVDLTAAIKSSGAENLLEIRCHVPAKSARFYFGAGIYRPLKLVLTSPMHVDYSGVFVTTELQQDGSAKINAQVDVKGTQTVEKVQIVNRVLGEDGMIIRQPKLWSPESPSLYTLETVLVCAGKPVDRVLTRFGVRTIEYRPKEGFFLNGKYRQMKGVCLHHDLGALGAAFDRGAFERQIKIMKSMGADAIRTSHNPPAVEVLEVCDEMGMLVVDEAFDCWQRHKYPADYATHFNEWHQKDLEDFVRRDRSHPCVVMWSIGNEIPGSLDSPRATESARIGSELTAICHRLDPTRPTTMGHCRALAMTNGMAQATDIFGANYLTRHYDWYLKHGSGKLGLIATETCSAVSTRGENDLTTFREANCVPDVEFAGQLANPACYGEFVWTGFDYLGEPDPHTKEGARSSYYGIVDLCGFPKERYWTYREHWRPSDPGTPDRESAGPFVRLEVTQERFRQLVYAKIRAVDANGATVTNFNRRLAFAVKGHGKLVGVCNGDPKDYDSLKGASIRAFHGLAQAIVRLDNGANENDCSLEVTLASPDVKVVYECNRALLEINGERMEPNINHDWSACAQGYAFDEKAYRLGFKIVDCGLWVSGNVERDDGGYDFSSLDRAAEAILKRLPDAYLYLNVWFAFPKWCAKHPDDIIQYADGKAGEGNADERLGRPIRPSAASPAFRAEVARFTKAMGEHVNAQPWGKHVALVRPSWGVYAEWHYWGMYHYPDVSKSMAGAFYQWDGGKWRDAALPTVEERNVGGWLDPVKNAKTIDYYRCMAEVTSDFLLFCCHEMRRAFPGRLIGAYYGYVMASHPPEGATVMLEKVLSSPDVDFLANPSMYTVGSRRAGGAYYHRTIPASFQRHGKLALIEDDMRFHHLRHTLKTKSELAICTETPRETQMTMRRNYINRLFDGAGMQINDPMSDSFGQRPHSYDDPAVFAGIREAQAVVAKVGRQGMDSGNEVALVVDPMMRLKVSSKPRNFDGGRIFAALEFAYRTGVAFDMLTEDDLKARRRQYRHVIRLAELVDNPPFSVAEWRKCFDSVGAEAIADSENYVRRHGNLILFHTAKSGKHTITPPADLRGMVATELFSGQTYADRQFEVTTDGCDTLLFQFRHNFGK